MEHINLLHNCERNAVESFLQDKYNQCCRFLTTYDQTKYSNMLDHCIKIYNDNQRSSDKFIK